MLMFVQIRNVTDKLIMRTKNLSQNQKKVILFNFVKIKFIERHVSQKGYNLTLGVAKVTNERP